MKETANINSKEVGVYLQPLRVPMGWEITYNCFYTIEPEYLLEGDNFLLFKSTLLQAENKRYNILLDVGWIDDRDPKSGYGLTLLRDLNWDDPLFDQVLLDRNELVELIEKLLSDVARGYYKK